MVSGHVRVRMYNVGFGDAFLVFLPTPQGERRMLFDCGTIGSAPGIPIEKVAKQIVTDVTDADGVPRIDVVVATHRHQDHVSGFAKQAWEPLEVKEVWMPWTEHPTDKLARQIRETQSGLAARLVARFEAQLAIAGLAAAEQSRLQGLRETALNALSNEDAMLRLHEGFVGKPKRRFLPEKGAASRSFETPALPGVTVHVLGPSRDKSVIADMEPPAGKSYLQLADDEDAAGGGPPEPFHPRWWMAGDDYASLSSLALADDERALVREASRGGSDELLAASLEDAVNGTSLMLVLQVENTHLLFPGDAQWGTWRVAMEDDECRALMKRTVFYKIGHHGSHNATPIEFVEQILGPEYCAMASTRKRGSWPVPKPELMTALAKPAKARVARSDEQPADASFVPFGTMALETKVPIV